MTNRPQGFGLSAFSERRVREKIEDMTEDAIQSSLGRAPLAAGAAPKCLVIDKGSRFWPLRGYTVHPSALTTPIEYEPALTLVFSFRLLGFALTAFLLGVLDFFMTNSP
jgi:hypothetical protein